MDPIITSSIPPQEFENILSKIAAILDIEMGNQYALDNTYPQINKVWCERVYAFDQTDLPSINVSLRKIEYSNSDLQKQQGDIIYNIDVYTQANTSDTDGAGDQYSMLLMEKILGMCRYILSYPGYNQPGIVSPRSYGMEVISIGILDKSSVKDALSTMVGRLQIMVSAEEVNASSDTGTILTESTTTVRLNGSEYGFFYDYRLDNIMITETGNTLTNAAFNISILVLQLQSASNAYLAEATYEAGTDFTQDGTTITAITFTFTQGQTYTATT